MSDDAFLRALQEEARNFTEAVATEEGDWIIKGFIDVYKRIYTVSVDTKVISKVMELLLIPKLIQFGTLHRYIPVLAQEQNFYPDISFISRETNERYAVDIKSTYRVNSRRVNGMTLGAFTGYFQDRDTAKNITFPYNSYKMHIILGIIYSQSEIASNEQKIYLIDDDKGIQNEYERITQENVNIYERIDSLEKISSVVKDFTFFVQPKYRIAHWLPGSGNTKNIGSIKIIDQLINGEGPFADLGEHIYDDYWLYYLTRGMSKELGIKRPYTNLITYHEYKKLGSNIRINKEKLKQFEENEDTDEIENSEIGEEEATE